MTFQDAVRNHDQIMALKLERYSDHELSDIALKNALQYKISTYDALYLSLAEIYLAPLVTADDSLFKACKDRFDFIEHLSEMSF